ncbi:sugar phosphate isomerase/epimerase [Rhodovulum tesquicola]|uniref:sugar phosphate isomerase/epimerase family protein n=1 Tax=Rhodovulum tesquicola TaxID=540254 RepID=UPI002097A1F1|nr:sugar phosphate isomerase/epimerase family protein [Rhodovulum tesquicola]MCO8146117.1 sugar phosphate isomerase/epimerase [Rhodovulum tesquicola]
MALPVIGAALDTAGLEIWRDWILEKNRDLELQAFHTAAVLDGDWSAEAAHTRKLLDGYTGRLGIHGPFWGFGIATSDPEVQRVVARRMDQGLDVCAAVGATHMVIHSPYTTWDYKNLDNYPDNRRNLMDNVHACIGAAVRRAEDQGVTLVMENIEDIDPRDRQRLVESFGSPALRLSLDTGHAHYAHGSTGAPPVDYFVTAAGALLDHVHLQDADGHADRHWAIGEGTILWPAVFRAIAALEVRPRLILELGDKAGIRASMDYLARMGLGE